jgi:hypothetical protein
MTLNSDSTLVLVLLAMMMVGVRDELLHITGTDRT